MHWALEMNRAGLQGELEHSGSLKLQELVEDRRPALVLLRPSTEAVVGRIYQWWDLLQRDRSWRELYLEEKSRWIILPRPSLN